MCVCPTFLLENNFFSEHTSNESFPFITFKLIFNTINMLIYYKDVHVVKYFERVFSF